MQHIATRRDCIVQAFRALNNLDGVRTSPVATLHGMSRQSALRRTNSLNVLRTSEVPISA